MVGDDEGVQIVRYPVYQYAMIFCQNENAHHLLELT